MRRRHIVQAFVSTAVMVVIAACSGGGNPQAEGTSAPSPRPVTSTASPSASARPKIPDTVCKVLAGKAVAGLIDAGGLTVEQETGKITRSYDCNVRSTTSEFGNFALHVEASRRDRSDAVASAVTRLNDTYVALPAELGEGMVGIEGAWLIRPCGDRDLDVVMSLSAGATTKAKREAVIRLMTEEVRWASERLGCKADLGSVGTDTTTRRTPERPLNGESKVCDVLSPERLDPVIGTNHSEWTATSTFAPNAPASVCALWMTGDAASVIIQTFRGRVVPYVEHGLRGASASRVVTRRCADGPVLYDLSSSHAVPTGDAHKLLEAWADAAAQRDGCPAG